ncbi:MAG TPA: endonuclease III [Bradyrhizobium sp.]|nr:endonuclease III [Bradyrhizobium sp.]HKO72770.1 endonuclease III [Bradyrhizobium sp.]
MACQYTPMMAKITRKPLLKSQSTTSKRARNSQGPHANQLKRDKPRKIAAKTNKAGAKTSPKAFRPWTPAEVQEAFSRFRKANPEPKGELEHLNPYTLLVAVVLSAQATDAGVNKATRALFAVADTPQKMIALGEEKLRDYIKTVGLYRTKAKNVIALSQKLIADFGGEVPRTRAEIESLPGAGRKTANVVLNMAFGERTLAVDTHVFRVSNRTGLARGDTPLEVELGLERVVPPEFMLHAHHWLILHGRYTCLARKPRCEVCLINDLCRWPEKTVQV